VKLEEKVSAADSEMIAETPVFSNEVGTAQCDVKAHASAVVRQGTLPAG